MMCLRRIFARCSWVVAASVAAGTVTAQVQQIEGGRALDANPMIGSGGINPALPRHPINRSNQIITGHVGGGMRFRGYAPIRDPSDFFVGLPSADLSGFRADSLSVRDVVTGVTNYQPRAYYDPRRTILNAGAIQRGLNIPGTSNARNTGVAPSADALPGPRDPLTGFSLPPREAWPGTGLMLEPRVQRVGPLRDSPQFPGLPLGGRADSVPLSELEDIGRGEPAPGTPAAIQQTIDRRRRGSITPGVRPDRRFPAPGETMPDRIEREGARLPTQVPTEAQTQIDTQMRVTQPVWPEPAAPGGDNIGRRVGGAGPAGVGEDRFRDMARAAQALQGGPLAPGPARPPGTGVDTHAFWAREYLARPVTGLSGTADTTVNRHLERADQEMRRGRYYEAAGYYSVAGTIDRRNPLPLIGQAQALIAAGEYMTAATLLERGIEAFPGFALFRVDLNAFIPDKRLLEERRADLERLLAASEDYRLRFLLGYIEYYSGLQPQGLDDLVKAARQAPSGSAIAEFPSRLKERLSILTEPPTTRPAPRSGPDAPAAGGRTLPRIPGATP